MPARTELISFMSDAKWLRTLRALATVSGQVSYIEWKFVDDARSWRTSVPEPRDLTTTGLKDGRFQPFLFREVEWLDVVAGDVGAIHASIASCGKRLLEASATGVRIVGYRKIVSKSPGSDVGNSLRVPVPSQMRRCTTKSLKGSSRLK
jgi:hypothetical protein